MLYVRLDRRTDEFVSQLDYSSSARTLLVDMINESIKLRHTHHAHLKRAWVVVWGFRRRWTILHHCAADFSDLFVIGVFMKE
ncbi:hypothetical protein CBR71_02945 [Bordetella hinzii]|nr:hypothetical protein CBR71_02945 [Bordetella hinzii]